MKYLLFLFLFLTSKNITAQYGFQIEGKFENHRLLKTIYLGIEDNYSLNRYKLIDSTTVKNGVFHFSGKLINPTDFAYLYTGDKKYFYYFFLDSGLNQIYFQKVNPNSFAKNNILSNAKKISSSKNPFEKIDSIRFKFFLKYGDNLNLEKRLVLLKSENEILRDHTSDFYFLIHLYQVANRSKIYNKLSPDSLLLLLESVSEVLKSTPLYAELKNKIDLMGGIRIGKSAPIFYMDNEAGIQISNENYKGRSYLLVFGATWCKPCKENLPALKNIYNKYKNIGFEILYINMDEKKEKWLSLIDSAKMDWVNISELKPWRKTNISSIYDIQFVPTYILIDSKGNIQFISNELERGINIQLDKLMN